MAWTWTIGQRKTERAREEGDLIRFVVTFRIRSSSNVCMSVGTEVEHFIQQYPIMKHLEATRTSSSDTVKSLGRGALKPLVFLNHTSPSSKAYKSP